MKEKLKSLGLMKKTQRIDNGPNLMPYPLYHGLNERKMYAAQTANSSTGSAIFVQYDYGMQRTCRSGG
jgi:hypothetical protein